MTQRRFDNELQKQRTEVAETENKREQYNRQ